MLPVYLALVSELPANVLQPALLMRVAAALQKQVTRDFGPLWGIQASVDAFGSLDDVPLDYWPIMVRNDIGFAGAAGIHLDEDGQPFALVQMSNTWTLTASHECLEMLADPFGNRLVAGQSVKPDQGRVRYLVEVCDSCEGLPFAYRVNNVTVSDFYTPRFFDPLQAPGVRYSFRGNINEPRQVLRGGYLSWEDIESRHWWQKVWFGPQPQFRDLGILGQLTGSIRSEIDKLTVKDINWRLKGVPANNRSLREAVSMFAVEDRADQSRASSLRAQIERLKAS